MIRWQLFGLSQLVALLVAAIMPITPSKTGSKWVPAELLFSDPSYVQRVAVNFVLADLVIALIAVSMIAMVRFDSWRGRG